MTAQHQVRALTKGLPGGSASLDAGGRVPLVELGNLYVNVKDPTYAGGAKGDNVTNDDAAFAAAYAAAGPDGAVFLPKGNYKLTVFDPPQRSTTWGLGESSSIWYSGTGTLSTITNKQRVKFHGLRFVMTDAAATLFKLDNSFRCTWTGCVFQGQHTTAGDAYGTTAGHIAVNITGNAGDNTWLNCDFLNMGVGIRTDSIQNSVIGGKFGTCYVGIHGTNTGARAGGGMSVSGYVDFVSGYPGIVAYNVLIDQPAGQWWFDQIWCEGADVCMKVGVDGLGGPTQFDVTNSKLTGSTTVLDIQYARQPYLANIQFGNNPGYTPKSININPNVVDGTAVNLISAYTGDPAISGTDYADGTFPQGWTYIGRQHMKLPVRLTGHSQLTSDANDKTALQVYGRNGQTVDIMAVFSNIGGTIAKRMWFDQFGLVHFGGGGGAGGQAAQAVFASSGQLGIYPAGTAAPNPDPAGSIDASLSVTARTAASRPVAVTGATGQTANLVDYRTTTGSTGAFTSTVRTAINAGGTYVALDAAAGVVLASPNGHFWRLTVDNAGALTTTDLGTTAPTT